MDITVRHFRGPAYLGKVTVHPLGNWKDIQAACTAAGHPLAKGDLIACVGGHFGHPLDDAFYGVIRRRKDGFPVTRKLEVD